MKCKSHLPVLFGLLVTNSVFADTSPAPTAPRSLGFVVQRASFSGESSSDIAFRSGSDSSAAWIVSGGGSVSSQARNYAPSSSYHVETGSINIFVGQRRYLRQAPHTRIFADGLFGGIADDVKTTYVSTDSGFSGSGESRFLSHSTALGVGVRMSFGGEYLFHPRAGVELSTSVEYRRLMWNLADTSSLHRASLSASSQVGVNWYW